MEENVSKIELDDSIRVVVLTGTGKSFCGGLDINQTAAEGINLADRTLRGGYETLHY